MRTRERSGGSGARPMDTTSARRRRSPFRRPLIRQGDGEALDGFRQDVEDGIFPAEEHSVYMQEDNWEALLEALD